MGLSGAGVCNPAMIVLGLIAQNKAKRNNHEDGFHQLLTKSTSNRHKNKVMFMAQSPDRTL